MAITMTLTNTITTVNIGPSYDIKLKNPGWAPVVARRRLDPFSGRLAYEDVDENPIELLITGTDTDDLLANYQELSDLLDRAEAWGPPFLREYTYAPVLFKYRKDGSTLTNPVYSPIWAQSGNQKILTVRSDFSDNKVLHATIRFRRLGLWLGDTETETTGSSTLNPVVLATGGFSGHTNLLVPHDIKVDIDRASGTTEHHVVLLGTNSSAKVYLANVADLTLTASGGAWTTPTVTSAYGSKVARYTFSGSLQSGEATTATLSVPVVNSTMSWWVIADNDTGASIDVVMQLYGAGDTTATAATGETTVIPSTATSPAIYPLGTLSVRPPITTAQLNINASGSGSVSGTIDFNTIVGIVMDDNTMVCDLPHALTVNTSPDIHIDHRVDSHEKPAIYQTDNAGSTVTAWQTYNGINLACNAETYTTGTDYYVIAVFGIDEAGSWMIGDGSTGSADVVCTATRTLAYLVPL